MCQMKSENFQNLRNRDGPSWRMWEIEGYPPKSRPVPRFYSDATGVSIQTSDQLDSAICNLLFAIGSPGNLLDAHFSVSGNASSDVPRGTNHIACSAPAPPSRGCNGSASTAWLGQSPRRWPT